MWFADFLYAHRLLGLERLVSIERSSGYRRALFNRPFRCIRVLRGDSSEVLPKLSWRRPELVWLDYDSKPSREALLDVSVLAAKLRSSSVVVVTYNAEAPTATEERPGEAAEAWARNVFGDIMPPGQDYPGLHRATSYGSGLISLLWTHLRSLLVQNGRSAEGYVWVPLFSFLYKDTVRMATVGAALLSNDDACALAASRLSELVAYPMGEVPFTIALPPLTHRERLAIDRCMPRGTPRLPFALPTGQLEAYMRLYRHYPVFAEVDL
jgi:hypothetical protein